MSHALLSPSAAHRWLNCSKSLHLEQQFPDNTSDAAIEGTIAHALCAEFLNRLVKNSACDEEAVVKDVRWSEAGFSMQDFDKWYGKDMLQYAMDYAIYVWGEYQEALSSTPDAILMVEKKLDISMYGPEMTGTTDAAIVSDKELHIFDFKYGRGVRVEAVNNPQMMIYALGNANYYGTMYGFADVIMTIYQPRIGNICDYNVTLPSLLKWGETELKPKAADAFNGMGDFVAGPWCKFCKAKAACQTCAQYCVRDFDNLKDKGLEVLAADEIASVIAKADDITSWLDAVKSYAAQQLRDGKKITGLKLVEGRSTRKYADEDGVVEILHNNGFDDEHIYDRKLKTITAMEKMMTKKLFQTLLSDKVIKPQGSPTLALESDPRPEINSVNDDFSDVDI